MARLRILAALASFMGIASLAIAQSSAPSSASPSSASPVGQGTTASAKPDPQKHLSDAQRRLDSVGTLTLSEDGKKKLSQLRENFTKLAAAYGQRPDAISHSTSNVSGKTSGYETADWNPAFYTVERNLVAILGGGSTLNTTSTTAVGTATVGTLVPQPATVDATSPVGAAVAASAQAGGASPAQAAAGSTPPSVGARSDGAAAGAAPGDATATLANPGGAGTTTATGSSTMAASSGTGQAGGVTGGNGVALGGVAVSEIGVKNLDPRVRAELEQVRTSIELFYDATTRVGLGTH